MELLARGIKARARRKYKATTDSNHGLPVAPNLLDRRFTVETPNRVWTSDIIYVARGEGWLYLAVVIDLFSCQVVGWSLKLHMKKDSVTDALRMAWPETTERKMRCERDILCVSLCIRQRNGQAFWRTAMESNNRKTSEIYATLAGRVNDAMVQKIFTQAANAVSNGVQTLHLMMQSTGGIINDGIALYNYLRTLPSKSPPTMPGRCSRSPSSFFWRPNGEKHPERQPS